MMEWFLYFMQYVVLAGTIYGCPFHGNLLGTWEVKDPYGGSMNATVTFGDDAVMTKQGGRTRMFLCKEIDLYERVLLMSMDGKGLMCLHFPFVYDTPMIMVRTSPHYVKYNDFFKPTPYMFYRPSILNTCDRFSNGELVFLSRR